MNNEDEDEENKIGSNGKQIQDEEYKKSLPLSQYLNHFIHVIKLKDLIISLYINQVLMPYLLFFLKIEFLILML